MKIYVKEEGGRIADLSTIPVLQCPTEVEADAIRLDQLAGYEILDGRLTFDDAKWERVSKEKEEQESFQKALEALERLKVEQILKGASDEDASLMTSLYPSWEAGIAVQVGERYQYDGALYRVIQAHTTQDGWEPDLVPALWSEVAI